MIKLLTGELEPQSGECWKHPSVRVAYLAQHAFHHIENHLQKTANEYIRWRYENGDDKESLVKVSMVLTDKEEQLQKLPIDVKDVESGKVVKRVVEKLMGSRRQAKNGDYEYDVKFAGQATTTSGIFLSGKLLSKQGWDKACKAIDLRLAQSLGVATRALTAANVEQHLNDVGLAPEFATHYRMSALSDGQKMKVTMAAALWN